VQFQDPVDEAGFGCLMGLIPPEKDPEGCAAGVGAGPGGSRTRPLVLTWALSGSLVFANEAAKDRPTLDSLLGKVGGWVVWPGWT
jgi:hypothetical protein